MWCDERNIIVLVVYIVGKNNIIVDYLLKLFSDLIEWKLNENIFENICEVLFYFDIDFFVFRLNK